MSCRFVASDQPRVMGGRHATGCTGEDCSGCAPCRELHCCICQRMHVERNTCTGCLEAARSDLKAIGDLCASLPAEAVEKGVQSEAMVMLGPASDPEAWRNRATSAMVGRLDASYLEDCRDEQHPMWVVFTWEQIWRDHLDHQTVAPFTLTAGFAYLDLQIGYMSEQVEPAFDEFARELRGCRAHLENILHDGVRVERGAPCVQCEKPMTRGEDEHWHCHTCHRTVTEAEYRFAVGAAYVAHSDRLTATEMAERIGVKASTIRVWGSRGQIAKRGRDNAGLTLYDVDSAIKRRDSSGQEKAG